MIVKNSMKAAPDRRGSALTMMTLASVSMAGLSMAMLTVTHSGHKELREERESVHARYIAQAGLSNAMYHLLRGESGVLGSAQNPVAWGNASFYVEQSVPGVDLVQLRATGLDERSGARLEVVLREVPNTIWRYAAFGDESLHMDSNAKTDSYDSEEDTYAAQAVNGSGATLHANEDGNVGSNGNVHMDSNVKVWGDAAAGPDHTTTVTGNAQVSGSTSPNADIIELPEIILPSYPSFGALTVSANQTIPSGNRAYTNMRVNASKTLTIVGPANIVITNLQIKSNAKIEIDATNGPVEIWVIDDFILNSNGSLAATNKKPKNVKLNLLSDNIINPEVQIELDEIELDSNAQMYGTLYAPNAHIEVDSNFQLYGAMIARSIDLDSNSGIHFDEELLEATANGQPAFETVCWREVPYSKASAAAQGGGGVYGGQQQQQ